MINCAMRIVLSIGQPNGGTCNILGGAEMFTNVHTRIWHIIPLIEHVEMLQGFMEIESLIFVQSNDFLLYVNIGRRQKTMIVKLPWY